MAIKERPGPTKNGWRYNSTQDLWERWYGGKVVESVTGLMARFVEQVNDNRAEHMAKVIFKEKK